ncbi:MAG TPA: ribonuclease P protein component [Candidatus Bacteroides pullicola]|uniref:Ribonuclease P protein component n=1 Tax=Candidatus Bacteroides pullicola TaxID=2838475 RepID=A0A9D1ZJL5_9BACE|nr:ribonuclease P protein component [Candidatus Bacteroides pullicola]
MTNTLHKAERLNRKKVIEKMFAGGSRSFSLFPLRVVWMPVDELDAPVSILVSVSKRHFKRAVKRNRVKRRVREAYRLNKQPLLNVVEQTGCHVAIAFIYLSDRVADSDVIAGRMRTALQRIGETLAASKVCEEAGGAKE